MKTYKIKTGKWVTEKPLTVKEKENKKKTIKEKLSSRETFLKDDSFDELQRAKAFEDVEKAEQDKLNSIWEKHKPKENEYKLIDTSVTIDESGKERGIINYKDETGNHKQIRF